MRSLFRRLTPHVLQRKLSAKSERVKAVDIHPREPWVLSALYDGKIFIWNYQTKVGGGGCLAHRLLVALTEVHHEGACQVVRGFAPSRALRSVHCTQVLDHCGMR
jgi:hypothetical protein